jgi:hypothetical protein
MTSAVSRHTASSYRYYSPIYLVLGPIQASRCTAWHLWIHLYFEDSHLKTLDSRVKFFKRFNSRVRATPNRCTYAVPLFNQLGKKHSTISCQSSWFLNWVLIKFIIDKQDPDHPASTHLPNTRGLLTSIGTQGTTPHRLGRPKEGFVMTQPTIQKIPKDNGVLRKV